MRKEAGELEAFMEDLKKDAVDMMDKLVEIESLLASLQVKLEKGEHISTSKMINDIQTTRMIIGSLEQEDERVIGESSEADTLLSKLKHWIDQVV